MAEKEQKSSGKSFQQRKLRMQQIFFGALAILIILSMILSAVMR